MNKQFSESAYDAVNRSVVSHKFYHVMLLTHLSLLSPGGLGEDFDI